MAKTPRKITLFGPVDEKMAAKVVGRLKSCNHVECLIHSEGGDLGAAFAIYDEIIRVPSSIGVITGTCFSASNLILQAFKVRLARPSSQFLVHEGRYEDEEFERKYAPFMNMRMKERLAKRMGWVSLERAYKERIFDVNFAMDVNMLDGIDGSYD